MKLKHYKHSDNYYNAIFNINAFKFNFFLCTFIFITLNVNFAFAPCPPNTFSCANGLECINETLKCDNIIHCSDGSDEATTLCSKLKGYCSMNNKLIPY